MSFGWFPLRTFFFDKPDEAAILKVKHRENGFFAWFNLKLKIKNINLEKF